MNITDINAEQWNEDISAFVQTASIGLHWVGADGVIQWANPADYEPLGYTKEEYIGHNIAEFHADQDVIEDILARLKENQRLQNYEARLRCKDGSIRDVVIDSSVLWREGKFIHTQCFTRDITARKRSEQRLRLQHAVSQVLAESPSISEALKRTLRIICNESEWHSGAVWLSNRDKEAIECAEFFPQDCQEIECFKQVSLNRKFIPGEGLPGHVWLSNESIWIEDLSNHNNFPRLASALESGLRSGVAFPIRVDGQAIGVLELFSRSARTRNSELLQSVASLGSQIGQFITRKQSEESLRHSQAQLSSLMALMPAGVYACDSTGQITFFNKRAVELWGRSPSQDDSQQKFCACYKVWRLDGTLVLPEETPMAQSVCDGKTFRDVEAIVERPDGTRFIACINIDPIYDSAGLRCGAINVFQDITARKRSELLLAKQNRALELMIAQAPLQDILYSLIDGVDVSLNVQCGAAFSLIAPTEQHLHLKASYKLVKGLEHVLDSISIHAPTTTSGIAASGGSLSVCENVAQGAYWDCIKDQRFLQSISAVWSVPILSSKGKTLGTLDIFLPEKRHPGPEEIQIVTDLSKTAAIAIEKSQSEALYQESQQFNRSIIESSRDCIKILTLEGKLCSMNEFGLTSLGISDFTPYAQKYWVDFWKTEDQQAARQAVETARNGGTGTFHGSCPTAKGELKWWDVQITPILSESGEPKQLLAVSRDITSRKKAEEEAQRVAQRLTLALSASNLGDWNWDAATDLVNFSHRAAEIFGIRPGPYMTWTEMRKMLHRDDEERVKKAVEDAILAKTDYDTEYRITRPDGISRWIAAKGRALYGTDGATVGMLGVVQDITSRKLDEESLKERTRSLQIVNQVGRTIAAELDTTKLVQAVTDAGREITGAAFGAFFYNMVDDKDEKYVLYTLSGAPKEAFSKFPMPRNTELFGPTFRGEDVIRIADVLSDHRYGKNPPYNGMPKGHLSVRSYLAAPVISRSGEVLGGLFFGHPEPGVFTESAEKIIAAIASHAAVALDNAKLYQQTRRHAQELEQKVQERTFKLQQTIAELEAFSYSISHDMRAPLRAMQGFSSALVKNYSNVLDEEGKDLLQRIHRAANRLDLLIQDVLNYSRIAKQELQVKPIDLNKFIPDIIETYPQFEKAKGNIQIQKPLHKVLAHEAFLSQIISNLVGNALKFIAPGVTPQVQIRSEHLGQMVKLWVEDNGIGIAPEHLARIFEIFGRIYPEKKYEGTGIGLAVVRKAVERLGGEVGVESILGQGSRFWIMLRQAE